MKNMKMSGVEALNGDVNASTKTYYSAFLFANRAYKNQSDDQDYSQVH